MSETEGEWDAEAVRALRGRLSASQQAFAEQLGTRQQTVSEWERGANRPQRMAQRLLTMIAESAGGSALDSGEDSPTSPESSAERGA